VKEKKRVSFCKEILLEFSISLWLINEHCVSTVKIVHGLQEPIFFFTNFENAKMYFFLKKWGLAKPKLTQIFTRKCGHLTIWDCSAM